MALLIVGLVIFFGVHSVAIVAPAWRAAQVARNPGLWKGAYSIASLIGFALLLYGYGLARQSPEVLYDPPRALRHLSLVLMLPVFPLLLAAYLPGWIRRTAKHPMLLATKLWAAAHLLANGTLADVLLFGGFLAWAVVDRIAVKRRPAAEHGADTVPPVARWGRNDLIAVVVGLAVYVFFLLRGHRWWIGVSPLG